MTEYSVYMYDLDIVIGFQEGRLSTKDEDFHIKEVPHNYKRHLNISDDETVLVVAKEKRIGKNTTLNNGELLNKTTF